jgi:methionyl-tRNA formyltransferase
MIGGELDSGDIIARDYLAIDQLTKVTRVWEWMSLRTPELMLEAVQMLDANPDYVLEQQSKDPKQALRCYPRKPEDGRIDWTKPAIDILRLINASNKPYAGAFCDFEGNKMIIWDAELVADDEIFCAVPGQVTKIGDVFIEVACGMGKIRVLSVEYGECNTLPDQIFKSIRMRLK